MCANFNKFEQFLTDLRQKTHYDINDKYTI